VYKKNEYQRNKPVGIYSKNGQLLGKNRQQAIDFDAQLCTFKLNELIIMDT
jgi:hypothetical protein